MSTMQRAERFIQALETLEREGDVEPLVALFSERCELSNVATERVFRGRSEVRSFWREYHGILHDARSRFRNVIVAGDRVALEWVTQGKAYNGEPLEYEGVSVLEFDGEEVLRFMAYFNPFELERELRPGKRRATTEDAQADVPRSEPPATAPA